VRATGTDPEALNNAAVNAVRALMLSDEAGAEVPVNRLPKLCRRRAVFLLIKRHSR
jgi:hypothetical protein